MPNRPLNVNKGKKEKVNAEFKQSLKEEGKIWTTKRLKHATHYNPHEGPKKESTHEGTKKKTDTIQNKNKT